MSCHTDFRIDFQSYGGCSGESRVDTEAIERLAGMPRFGTGRIVRWLVYAVPAVYLALFALWLTGMVAGNVIVAVFIFLLVLSGLFAKRVTRIQEQLNRTLQSLSRYSRLFEMMERTRFRCKPLSELQSRCVDSNGSVSQRVSRLRHLLSNLDQRYNFVGFALLNGFLLWDLRQINALDRWLCDNREKITQWIDVLSRFDVYVSLGTFRYNHPDYVFPDIREDRTPVMQAEALGHPLIPRPCGAPARDCRMKTGPSAPSVCPESMTFTPLPLFTGLRASDSLADNESYFFAELKRLQQIVLRLRRGEKLFIILDEILRGTNSVDKQTGSLALIRQLVGAGATGIIATHDLALGKLADSLPGKVSNYRFEAAIQGDELTFSYRLQPGIAENMNACFLMKKMGIIPSDYSENN